MITEDIRFVYFQLSTDHIYGLDQNGKLWYRDKIPFSSTTYNYGNVNVVSAKDKEEKKKKTIWKPVGQRCEVSIPTGGNEKEAQLSTTEDPDVEVEVEAVPTSTIKPFPDEKTIRMVQTALKEKGFMTAGHIDGVLGPRTSAAIRQMMLDRRGRGDIDTIDPNVLEALELNPVNEEKENVVSS
jgi:hypothetical protein